MLFVDEAHSFGTLGKGGRGLLEHWQEQPEGAHITRADIDVTMGTLSKVGRSGSGEGGQSADRTLTARGHMSERVSDDCPLFNLRLVSCARRRFRAWVASSRAARLCAISSRCVRRAMWPPCRPQALTPTPALCESHAARSLLLFLLLVPVQGRRFRVLRRRLPRRRSRGPGGRARAEARAERVDRLRTRSKMFIDCALAQDPPLKIGGYMDGSPVVAVIVGGSVRCAMLSQRLFEKHRVNVKPIVYPAVEESMARLRFFMSTLHTDDDLQRTVEAIAVELKQLKEDGI